MCVRGVCRADIQKLGWAVVGNKLRRSGISWGQPPPSAASPCSGSQCDWVQLLVLDNQVCWVGDQRPLNNSPSKTALNPILPELSVNRCMSGAVVHSGRRNKEQPVHGEFLQSRSTWEPWSRMMVSSDCGVVALRSTTRQRKVWLAGSILAAKLNVPRSPLQAGVESDFEFPELGEWELGL